MATRNTQLISWKIRKADNRNCLGGVLRDVEGEAGLREGGGVVVHVLHLDTHLNTEEKLRTDIPTDRQTDKVFRIVKLDIRLENMQLCNYIKLTVLRKFINVITWNT